MKSNWNYPTTVWVGKDRVKDLGEGCHNLKVNNPLFVTDKDLVNLPFIKEVISEIKKKLKKLILFSNFTGNPFGDNVDSQTLTSWVNSGGSEKEFLGNEKYCNFYTIN